MSIDTVIIRLSRDADAAALADLATLDSAPAPRGQVLVAQVGDELWAAMPLDGGRAFADPFRRSGQLVPLLEARAMQLRGAPVVVRRRRLPRRAAAAA